LKRSVHGKFPSLSIRKEVNNHLLATQVTNGKIGVGPLTKGGKGDVYSEASMLVGVGRLPYVASFLTSTTSPKSSTMLST
jgi:hypothetical protein